MTAPWNPSPSEGMTLLHSQAVFESLIGRGENPDEKCPELCIIYFTARWCGACKKLDLSRLVGSYPLAAWFKCDIDANDYTPGFCGVRSIPAFLLIRNKKIIGQLANSNTETVLEWIHKTLAEDQEKSK